MNIEVNVKVDHPLVAAPDPARLAKAAAIACADRVRANFRRRNAAPNAKGFPRSHYWNAAAEATRWEADGAGARVVVRHDGIAARLHGPTRIAAKTARMLALPLRPQFAHLRPKAAFPNKDAAFVWRSPKGNAFLAYRDPDGRLRLAYLLVPSVTLKADPGVIPPRAELEAAASAAAHAIVERELRRAKGGAR